MLTDITGAKCVGIDAVKVTVETDITSGIGIHLVGLADVAVKESLLRTTTALGSLSFHIPGRKIVINLAPADLRKSGSGYDLPIAVGIIAASGQMEFDGADRYVIMGELGLNAEVRYIPGGLPIAEMARAEGFRGAILPYDSALEAAEIRGLPVYGVKSLPEVLRILSGREDCEDLLIWNRCAERGQGPDTPDRDIPDFADILGQEQAKRGMEIAAAGGHNIMMLGAPGSGKSSLAKALPGILPPMSPEEALTTSKIYSVAGKANPGFGLLRRRPFRSPHCSASIPAIIGGGGAEGVYPGEITLAQGGVLFLDEFGQMPKSVIEALRGPMEDRKVVISRLKCKVEYPASFMLVAASNPCPCGYFGEGERCRCTPVQRANYLSRLSGPIMDRIDIQVWLKTVDTAVIMQNRKGESSAEVARRVLAARERQKKRFGEGDIFVNAEMSARDLDTFCPLDNSCMEMMERLINGMGLSVRAYHRIIRVARTIADLEGAEAIRPEHLCEAAGYRFLDKVQTL
ncbi:MAG: YifB family Mg chelatase-like AAA ATPase [Bacteroidales bacterium]|nr:YifB family Mg chelatase-like AAA ATPase [Bacteroidales bacterium]